MFRTVTLAGILLAAAGLAAAEEADAVRLARAEVTVARAHLAVVVAEAKLALAEADAELTAKLDDLSRRYASAKAKLETTPKSDPAHIKHRLIFSQLAAELAYLKGAGPQRIVLLQAVWAARTALAEAKLALAKVRLSIELRKQPPGKDG